MISIQGLAARLDRLEQWVERLTGNMVDFTTLARTSASGVDDQAHVAGNPTDRQRPVRRVAPWGLSGRPVPAAGVFGAIVKAFGGAFNGLLVGIATDRYGPQGLSEGETCLWNKGVAQILLEQNDRIVIKSGASQIVINKDGDITIDAGGQIKLAGGGPGIARNGDSVQVTIPSGSFLTSAQAGVLNATPVKVTGMITAGSTRAQAG
jgi:phage gp45-like